MLKRAVATVPMGGGTSKPRIPEPKPFGGAKSFKELENFFMGHGAVLWGG